MSHSSYSGSYFGVDSVNSGFFNKNAKSLVKIENNCPYPGWLFYFPTISYERDGSAAHYTKVYVYFFIVLGFD